MNKDEIQRLFDEHETLVYATVEKRFNSQSFRNAHILTKDDLHQYGRLGLLHACRTYDKNRNTKFRSYAISNIAWSISVESKRDSLSNRTTENFDLVDRVSLDEELENDSDAAANTLHDIVESYELGYEEVEFNDLLDNMRRELPEALVKIVEMRLDGYVYVDIAKALGVTQQAVRQRLMTNKSKIVDLLLV